jgi:predicted flap endonuclease-1-like 5' DNA nuclease
MIWLQENWIIAVVGLVVAVVLLWWLFGRSKPEDIAPTVVEPAKPAKPLEPVKPEIIAAEPARFKPIEPKPQPVTPAAPPPAPEPVAKAAPSAPEPAPAPKPAPVAEPVAKAQPPAPKPAAKPKAAAKPAAKKTTAKEPAAKPAAKPATKTATKPAAKKAAKPAPAKAVAAIPEEPTVPPPPAAKPAPAAPKTGADNLQLLKGVGPKLAVLLSGLGVTSFRQIADWTDADIARIDPQLGAFQGRIARDNIVDQAGYLARGDKAGFEAKYGALGGEL